MLKVALTHDVDRIDKTFQYFTHFKSNLKQVITSGLHSGIKNYFNRDAYFMINDVMKIEDKHGVKSTFFFLQESIPFNIFQKSNWPLSLGYYNFKDRRLKQIYPHLLSGGWEIGLHGSYLSFDNYDLLVKEKQLLEDAIESEIYGIRQHFLNLSKDTWAKQAKAGFTYDASWGYTRDIGFRDKIYKEFYPLENNSFKVVPLALMDFCVVQIHDYIEKVIEVIEECIKNNGLLVVNWHQRTFNDFEFPKYRKSYEEIILLCKSFNASFYTLNDYLVSNDILK